MSNRKRRCTAREHEARLQQVIERVRRGERRWKIIAFLNDKYGLQERQSDFYIRDAKALLAQDFLKPKSEKVEDQYHYFKAVSEDYEQPPPIRLRARELLGRLMGLDAPTRVAPVTPDGERSYAIAAAQLTTEQLVALEALDAAHQRALEESEENAAIQAAS